MFRTSPSCFLRVTCQSSLHGLGDDAPDLLHRLDEVTVGEVGIRRRGRVPSVPEQLADQGQVLARHGSMAGRIFPAI